MRYHSFKPHPLQPTDSRDEGLANLLRCCIRHADELIKYVPLTSFPQDSCNLGFGRDELPLPMGALVTLWHNWPPGVARCPECRSAAFLYSLVASEGNGDLEMACTVCGRLHGCRVGCQDQMVLSANRALVETPYPITKISPRPLSEDSVWLLDAFAELGIDDGAAALDRRAYDMRLHWFRARMR